MAARQTAERIRLPAWVVGFLLGAALLAAGVWWVSFTDALARLEDRGRADLRLASDRLVSELQQFRELAILLADHPTLADLLRAEPAAAMPSQAAALLLRTADKMGTLEITLADRTGQVVAASNRSERGAVGSVAGKPSFQRAMQGALGAHHEQRSDGSGRAYTFAAPIFAGAVQPIGAVSVDVSVSAVEWGWVGDPQAIYFTDALGVVFVSNRMELLLRQQDGAPDDARALAAFGYGPGVIRPFVEHRISHVGKAEIWALDGGPYLPARALRLTQPLPVIGMRGEILLDVAPALRLANLQAAVAGALLLVLGAVLFALGERRRALAGRLAMEAAANAALEARVAARTAELLQANARLTQAQQDLVQAGKLSALGQMSAGISHELNQPLMAIRSYAENAEAFLQRGQSDVAGENLGRISELARRMGRIIKNLRAFARNESEPVSDVDLVAVVEAALELSEPKAARGGVQIKWVRPDKSVFVRGGEVRLQQVVMNLIGNACDAMEGAERREISIALSRGKGTVRLKITDTGPGIAEPDRIFDPFYSTKAVSSSEGMGLGLSISYGLVQSFGGAIRGSNRPEGGAEFTVELAPSEARKPGRAA